MKNFKRKLILPILICVLSTLIVGQLYADPTYTITKTPFVPNPIPHGGTATSTYTVTYNISEQQKDKKYTLVVKCMDRDIIRNDLLDEHTYTIQHAEPGNQTLTGSFTLRNDCGTIKGDKGHSGESCCEIFLHVSGCNETSPDEDVEGYQTGLMPPHPGFTLTDDVCRLRNDTARIAITLHDSLKGVQSGDLTVLFNNTFLQAMSAKIDHRLFDIVHSNITISDTAVAFHLVPLNPQLFSLAPIGSILFAVKESAPYQETTFGFDTLSSFIDTAAVPLPCYFMKSGFSVVPFDDSAPVIHPELITCFPEHAYGLVGSVTDNFVDLPEWVNISWFDKNDSLLGRTSIETDGSFLLGNHSTELFPGDSVYMVAADEAGNSSAPAEFVVLTPPAPPMPGWAQKESMPTVVKGKYVKDGGAIVAIMPLDEVDWFNYAFRGNKSNEFYKYTPTTNKWTQMASIPFGKKWPDTTKINNKTIGKGAALCWDGANTIYATRGNGTKEFWAYNISDCTWVPKPFVPVPKGLKGGTSLAFSDGKVYLLAGGQKKTESNFFAYDTATNNWTTLSKAPLTPNNKAWTDGSCIAIIDSIIYALKGGDKHNYFFAYNVKSPGWTEKDTLPLIHTSLPKKKNKVKDGGAMTTDGIVLYAIKGGGVQDFWKYTPGTPGVWECLDTIPRLHKKSVPKTGAALAYADGKVYLLKGNNTPEFWIWGDTLGYEYSSVNIQIDQLDGFSELPEEFALAQNYPNPFNPTTTIEFQLPELAIVTLKVYNMLGQEVATIIEHEEMDEGEQEVEFTAERLASGVYFYRLVAQGIEDEDTGELGQTFVSVKKMLLLK
ncbi:MAG: T9SS type A sorting domain-containing protein [Bacteroidota bacterium]|nr:T9SS type A sorting domain-containing protein [Bacteroidota bacterium]